MSGHGQWLLHCPIFTCRLTSRGLGARGMVGPSLIFLAFPVQVKGYLECPKWDSELCWGPCPLPKSPSTYWMLESRPWVMTPVNRVVLLVSTSIHWVCDSSSAHQAPS